MKDASRIGKTERDELLLNISGALDVIIMELTSEGKFLHVWCANKALLFLPEAEFIGKNMLDVFDLELSKKLYGAIQHVLQGKGIAEISYPSPDGSHYFNARLGFFDREAKTIGVLVHDITSYKTTEEKIKESEEKYRKLFQHSLDIVTVVDPNGIILFDSFSKLTQFGYEQPIVGHCVFDFIHPDEKEEALVHFTKAMHTKGTYGPIELRFKSNTGMYKYIEVMGVNLFDEPLINGYVLNSRDITERRCIEKTLNQAHAKLHAIIESTDDIIFAVDKDLKYLAFNQNHVHAIKTFYGVEPKIGESVLIDNKEVAAYDREQLLGHFSRALKGERFTISYNLAHLNQPMLFSELSFNPILNDKNETTGVAVFSKDVTKQVLTQQELEASKNTAEAAAKAKSDFLSNMSHEIRTPINAIMGMTDLLLEKAHDEESLEYLKSIKYASDNLLVIINDILDFSKLDAGKVHLEKIDFHLPSTLDAIAKLFSMRALEKQLKFSMHLDNDVPAMLKGDPYRLNQILLNVLGNALKFTEKGEVCLTIRKSKTKGQFVFICFEIKDTGTGIPEHKLESIFESFSQAYTDITRKFGGTGLGLAITRKLVQLQEGSIHVNSKVNEGSTFEICIPYLKSETHPSFAPTAVVPVKKDTLTKSHILIVEDNALNQMLIKHLLKSWGCTFDVVENGLHAIQKLHSNIYDLVLMDLQMPEMSGYEATRIIRSSEMPVLNPLIPIIAITADAFPETRKRVLQTGMNDFIAKPFDKDELYQKIAQVIIK